MGLKIDIELDKKTLDFSVTELDLEKGSVLTWGDIARLRDRLDRALEQRDRIEAQRRADARRATG